MDAYSVGDHVATVTFGEYRTMSGDTTSGIGHEKDGFFFYSSAICS